MTAERPGGAADVTAGLQRIQPQDIELVPAPDVSGDLANYLTTLPSVVTAGDQGGQLFIRGGEPSQNQVRLDGIPLYQPFHVIGFYSAFPSDIVSGVDFSAGGYGARYGGFLSSVLDVSARTGNKRAFQANGAASPFIVSFGAEGPIVQDYLSVMVSGAAGRRRAGRLAARRARPAVRVLGRVREAPRQAQRREPDLLHGHPHDGRRARGRPALAGHLAPPVDELGRRVPPALPPGPVRPDGRPRPLVQPARDDAGRGRPRARLHHRPIRDRVPAHAQRAVRGDQLRRRARSVPARRGARRSVLRLLGGAPDGHRGGGVRRAGLPVRSAPAPPGHSHHDGAERAGRVRGAQGARRPRPRRPPGQRGGRPLPPVARRAQRPAGRDEPVHGLDLVARRAGPRPAPTLSAATSSARSRASAWRRRGSTRRSTTCPSASFPRPRRSRRRSARRTAPPPAPTSGWR